MWELAEGLMVNPKANHRSTPRVCAVNHVATARWTAPGQIEKCGDKVVVSDYNNNITRNQETARTSLEHG